MYTHLVFDDSSAGHLREYLKNNPKLQGELLVFLDDLSVGPLKSISARSRQKWWKKVLLKNEFISVEQYAQDLDDSNKIKALGKIKNTIYIWLAPVAFDELTLMRISSQLAKLKTDIYLIPVEEKHGIIPGYLSLGEIGSDPVKINKFLKNNKKLSTNKLSKLAEKWRKVSDDKSLLRKWIRPFTFKPLAETYFDSKIIRNSGDTFANPAKIYCKFMLPNSMLYYSFIEWRIQKLIKAGKLLCQGDSTSSRKYQVKQSN